MSKSITDSPNLGKLIGELYDRLTGLTPEDRAKVLNSINELFGNSPVVATTKVALGSMAGDNSVTAQSYFAEKVPTNRGEELATASRYLEKHGNGTSHAVEDFAKFFAEVRQSFDRTHFARDINNAMNNAKLFIRGTDRGSYQLSHYGQKYVDMLPDREALKKLDRPGRRASKQKK